MFTTLTTQLLTGLINSANKPLRLCILSLMMFLTLVVPVNATAQTLTSNNHHALFGNWIIDTPEHITLLQLNRDLSYLYINLNHLTPHQSVAEWGRLAIEPNGVRFMASYSNNPLLGLVAYQITHPKLHIALDVESKKLVFTIDTNADSISDEQHNYYAYKRQSIFGVWHQLSTPALSSVVLLSSGYYALVNVNLHQDPHIHPHNTHLQWGRFEEQQEFSEPIFDSHPQLTSALPRMIFQPLRQQLALSFDQDTDHNTDHLPLFKQ